MGQEITLITAGSLLLRLAIIAAVAWFFYRVLRRRPARVRNDSQSRYAQERWHSTRHQR